MQNFKGKYHSLRQEDLEGTIDIGLVYTKRLGNIPRYKKSKKSLEAACEYENILGSV